MKQEPAIGIGLITTAVTSVLALLIAFGIDLTTNQQLAVLGIIAGVGPLVAAVFTRGRVFAPANVAAAVTSSGRTVAGPASPIPDDSLVAVVPAL